MGCAIQKRTKKVEFSLKEFKINPKIIKRRRVNVRIKSKSVLQTILEADPELEFSHCQEVSFIDEALTS